MSTASKITLASTLASAVGIVIFVHYAQKSEQSAMHAGVLRDMEQQKVKRERLADFEMQKELEAEYKKLQKVHDSSTPLGSTT